MIYIYLSDTSIVSIYETRTPNCTRAIKSYTIEHIKMVFVTLNTDIQSIVCSSLFAYIVFVVVVALVVVIKHPTKLLSNKWLTSLHFFFFFSFFFACNFVLLFCSFRMQIGSRTQNSISLICWNSLFSTFISHHSISITKMNTEYTVRCAHKHFRSRITTALVCC